MYSIDFHYCLTTFNIWASKLGPWCLVINSNCMARFEFKLFLVSHSYSRSGFFFLELFDRSACIFDQLITWCVVSFLITQYHLSMLPRLVHLIFFTRIQNRCHEFGTGQTKSMPLSKSNLQSWYPNGSGFTEGVGMKGSVMELCIFHARTKHV